MVVSEQLYASSTFLTGVVSVSLGLYITTFEEPVIDVRGLVVYLLCTGIATFMFTGLIVSNTTTEMLALLNANWAFVLLGLFGLVHFGFALTGRLDSLTDAMVTAGVVFGGALLVVMWTDGIVHNLFRAQIITYHQPFSMVDIVYGPLGYTFVAFTTILVATGTYLVLTHLYRSQATYRIQGALVFSAIALPWLSSMATLVDWPSPILNLTPQSAAISGILFAGAIVGYGFLDIVPLAYEQVVESIDQYVIIVDPKGRVVNHNEKARELLDGEEYIGADIQTVFPAAVPHLGEETETVETELTLPRDGQRTVYSLRNSPLRGADGRVIGRTITLQEVTEIRNRERELDLLKQVLTRVLRHNIRNDLMVIRMQAEAIESEHSGSDEHVQTILDTADSLVTTSEKARAIERVLELGDETVRFELASLVDSVVSEVESRYPDVTWSVDVPQSVLFQAHPLFELALENVLENAAEHNDSPQPEVRISASDGQPVTLRVVDNGPGIPIDEQDVLERREETKLEHGSGVGLWLVNWIVQKSRGDIAIDATDGGTTVTFTLAGDTESAGPSPDESGDTRQPHSPADRSTSAEERVDGIGND